jgi:hypothetical protein
MDLSFINLPASQDELLGLLKVAYQAGQNSVGARIETNTRCTSDDDNSIATAVPIKKYTFRAWLNRLVNQWSNAEE